MAQKKVSELFAQIPYTTINLVNSSIEPPQALRYFSQHLLLHK